MSAQTRNWEVVRQLLTEAAASLRAEDSRTNEGLEAGPLYPTWPAFTDFLEHNELGLAWDTLYSLGKEDLLNSDFWTRLAEAATVMGLTKQVKSAKTRAAAVPLIRAFIEVHGDASIDFVVADPDLNRAFLDRCRELGAEGSDAELNWKLYNARKAAKLPEIGRTTRYTISADRRDEFEWASEMAVRVVQRKHENVSLDRIICTPGLRQEFDQTASRLAPGFTALEYRWAALGLRKARRLPTKAPAVSTAPTDLHLQPLGDTVAVQPDRLPVQGGVYHFKSHADSLFVGETRNLRRRYQRHLQVGEGGFPRWLYEHSNGIELSISPLPQASLARRKQIELALISRFKPLFNVAPETLRRTTVSG